MSSSRIRRDLRSLAYRLKRRAAFLGAVVLLKVIDLLLRRFGYQRTSRLLLRLSPQPVSARSDYTRARLLAIAVDTAAAQRIVDVTCLRRSLALWWLMRWLRLPSSVHLAFRMTDGRADGHAWVEHHQRVINDYPDIGALYPIRYDDRLSPESLDRIL